MKIHIITGLPASGKTTFAHDKFKGMLIIDDPIDLHECEEIASDFVLVDQSLCIQQAFENCRSIMNSMYDCEIITWCFENDPSQCLENAKLRPEKAVNGQIKYLARHYKTHLYTDAFMIECYKQGN